MRNSVILAIVLTLAGAHAQAASPLAGNWDVVVTAPQGVFPSTVTFEETDEGFVVTGLDAGRGSPQASDVTVEGDRFSFTRTLDFGQGPQPFVYSGAAAGDAMSGTVESAVGPMTFTGTRKQHDAAE